MRASLLVSGIVIAIGFAAIAFAAPAPAPPPPPPAAQPTPPQTQSSRPDPQYNPQQITALRCNKNKVAYNLKYGSGKLKKLSSLCCLTLMSEHDARKQLPNCQKIKAKIQ